MNDDGICALPRALRLQWHCDSSVHKPEHEPGMILVVPQSHFHFDVTDPTRTRGLIPPFDASDEHVRFPTTSAFLDAIIDTIFEPVDGVSHLDFRTSYLSVFLSYLVLYNVRDEDGAIDSDTMDLLPAAKMLLEGVKAENFAYLDAFMRTGSTRMTPELTEERKHIKNARIVQSM